MSLKINKATMDAKNILKHHPMNLSMQASHKTMQEKIVPRLQTKFYLWFFPYMNYLMINFKSFIPRNFANSVFVSLHSFRQFLFKFFRMKFLSFIPSSLTFVSNTHFFSKFFSEFLTFIPNFFYIFLSPLISHIVSYMTTFTKHPKIFSLPFIRNTFEFSPLEPFANTFAVKIFTTISFSKFFT